MPATERATHAHAEYIAKLTLNGAVVYRRSPDGLLTIICKCADFSTAQAVAIELSIVEYVRARNRSGDSKTNR